MRATAFWRWRHRLTTRPSVDPGGASWSGGTSPVRSSTGSAATEAAGASDRWLRRPLGSPTTSSSPSEIDPGGSGAVPRRVGSGAEERRVAVGCGCGSEHGGRRCRGVSHRAPAGPRRRVGFFGSELALPVVAQSRDVSPRQTRASIPLEAVARREHGIQRGSVSCPGRVTSCAVRRSGSRRTRRHRCLVRSHRRERRRRRNGRAATCRP